jgi:uncharacterized membrane protein
MGQYLNKKTPPVIISVCLIGYYILLGLFLIKLNISNMIKIIAIIVSIIITMTIIKVLIERIKEIDGGEENDLGKY